MRRTAGVCVVVDGFSTANALAAAFAGYGYPTLHVHSRAGLPSVLLGSHRPEQYVGDLVLDGSLDPVTDWLAAHHLTPLCVVAGAESGVEVADRLAAALGVPGNDPATSLQRRHKGAMSLAVAGIVDTIPQLRASSLAEVRGWVDEHGYDDVVVKPPASSGSAGFTRCDGAAEVEAAVEALLGSRDFFGDAVDEVIVQPFLSGDEYAVNTVSRGGRTVVVDAWHTTKRASGAHLLYDLEVLLDGTDPVFAELERFTRRVLDALGIVEGAAHTEIKVGADGRLRLIETGARPMGSIDLSQLTATVGTNVVQVLAESVVSAESFRERAEHAPTPRLRRHGAMVQMLSTQHGTLASYGFDELERLATFHTVDTYLAAGDALVPTVDSYSTPGLIFLVGDSREALRRDYTTIRELEAAGALFVADAARTAEPAGRPGR